MPSLAIILYEGSPGSRELRLQRILDFFGVPWEEIDASQIGKKGASGLEYAAFGSIRAVAAALKGYEAADPAVLRPTAFYAYLDDERSLCVSALRSLLGDANLSIQETPSGKVTVSVSDELADVSGPMAGLKVSLKLSDEDAVLSGAPAGRESKFATIMSAGDAPVFVRFQRHGTPVFLCTSLRMVDIDQPVNGRFYDVKDHFCSAVPLIAFIKLMFPEVAWQPRELGACLIIDDPLLKFRYGFCNFSKLRELMRKHGFTTNIAFIPWNWRRTSPGASKLFSDKSGFFSVSIHGCDHTAGEFGATSPDVLHSRAHLARSRMRSHELRTGIQHDSIMVFPQGAFSSACPEVLKRDGYMAAVNTEISPVDSQNSRTRIRDVWDVAIMAYGDFPVFTRRYAFHGIENFAFDILLGKPCLIVAHHDFFKDGGAALIELIEKIKALNCKVSWRSLGEVIRRSCRHRALGAGTEEFEMYGSELLVANPSNEAIEARIRKRKGGDDLPSEIFCDDNPVRWATEDGYFVFSESIPPQCEKRFRVVYPEQGDAEQAHRSLRFELAVAARRILSEFRDNYLATNRFLSSPANILRSVFRKAI
jgi:hypothetical protein